MSGVRDEELWESIYPAVNSEAEFYEIVNDFGDPLELLREAISNSIDHHATEMSIEFAVESIEGVDRSVITIRDNGDGMNRNRLEKSFWGLGFSESKGRSDAIGEKGHGTKIFLRSEKVIVKTQCAEGAFLSECDRPLSFLARNQLHQPRIRPTDNHWSHTGTEVKIIGYNDNECSKYRQELVKDYILWFTKVGSIELLLDIDRLGEFKIYLKCLDWQKDAEPITFGHKFPDESSDLNRLFEERGTDAADYYVKRYIWKEQRLQNHPHVTFDVVISVEGDAIKRAYNPMLGDRRRKDTGRYLVRDRYGLWLCKDYIPIVRRNDWVSGFGTGSGAYVLLHGFVNCQRFKLTANRGDIANSDPKILDEIRSSVERLIEQIDIESNKKELFTLKNWQQEFRTLEQEKAEFERRKKNLGKRKSSKFGDSVFIEPSNESELFGLFITINTLCPELFEFEPLDYNTTRGIDVIARNRTGNPIIEGEYSYVELKYLLSNKQFNHAFRYLRWVVCWDFDKSVAPDIEFVGIEDGDVRKLKFAKDKEGHSIYFLDSNRLAHKIQIIRLKEVLEQKLNLKFELHNKET